jgi:hypothetical protein
VTREIGEPLRRLALLVKAKGGRDSVICVDPALNTRAPSEELDDGCWIGYCEQLVVGLVKAGDERLNRFCVEARILWELDFNVPGLLSAVRLTPDELDTQIKQPTPRARVDEGGPNRPGPSLENRVGVVIGAARGIGESTARKLAREGARLALWDRDEARPERTATPLKGIADRRGE